jgi:hypothetical protein
VVLRNNYLFRVIALICSPTGLDFPISLDRLAVHDRNSVLDPQPIAADGDDPLDEVRVRELRGRLGACLAVLARHTALVSAVGPDRRMEDDDVADRRIADVVADAVHQDPLADFERRQHRLRGDLVRLDDEGLNAERESDRERDDDDELDERPEAGLRLRDQPSFAV